MYKKIVFCVSFLFPWVFFSQSTLKTMVYNLLEFPEANPQNRELILRDIVNEYTPDIFMVCELQSSFGGDLILDASLNFLENKYSSATFVPNQSGGANLQQLLFYRKDKFILEKEAVIQTNIRDINHYTLILSTANMQTNPVRIEVFVAHLKSSQGGTNEQIRLEMVEAFTNQLENLDPNAFVLFAGDLNLYSSIEPAYIELLNPTNTIPMADPINTFGAWSGNINFQDIHTQSTRISSGPFGAGAGGGMDDRFDFILVSQNMLSNPTLHYVPNTYKAFGNNGNCFDLSINDSACSGFYTEVLRENLYNMSDHLPVVMELETPEEIVILNTPSSMVAKPSWFLKNTLVSEVLEIQNTQSQPLTLNLLTTLGQRITVITLKGREKETLDVSYLPSGVYFLTDTFKREGVQKFIKQ